MINSNYWLQFSNMKFYCKNNLKRFPQLKKIKIQQKNNKIKVESQAF